MPQEIKISDRSITILWNDGHTSFYAHRLLRLRCQCAHCVDEMSGQARIVPHTISDDVLAVDHMQVGNYGVQFLWSDAHYTGIYTYSYLRSLCTCATCETARAKGIEPKRELNP